MATMSESGDPEVEATRQTFWRHRFQVAGDLIRSVAGRDLDEAAVDAVIEQLIGPLFLRAFVTGAPINDGFIKASVKRTLQDLSKSPKSGLHPRSSRAAAVRRRGATPGRRRV
jgi:hypothetical protein